MKKYILPMLVIILLVCDLNIAAQETREKPSDDKNALNTITIETPNGKVTIKLPRNVHCGDVISGTVVAKPKGKNEKQKQKNKNILNGMVIELNEKEAPLIDDKFTWQLPESVNKQGAFLKLINDKGKVFEQVLIPITETLRTILPPELLSEFDFRIPDYLRAGETEMIPGVFDGDFNNSIIKLNGVETEILAESPEGIFFETQEDLIGKTTVELVENNFEMAGETNTILLTLGADKLALSKGESTNINIELRGLQDIETEVPLNILNLTQTSIQMDEGNSQHFNINSTEISADGIYRHTTNVTASKAGGFSVQVDVEEAKSGFVKIISPSEAEEFETIPTELEWTAYGMPDNVSYDYKHYILKEDEMPSDMELDAFQAQFNQQGLKEPRVSLSSGEELAPDEVLVVVVHATDSEYNVLNNNDNPTVYYSSSSKRCHCRHVYAGNVYADLIDENNDNKIVTYVELDSDPNTVYLPEKELTLKFKDAKLKCGKCGSVNCKPSFVTYDPKEPKITPSSNIQTLSVSVCWQCTSVGCQSADCNYSYKLRYKRASTKCTCGDVKVTVKATVLKAEDPTLQGEVKEVSKHCHVKSLGQQRLNIWKKANFKDGDKIEVHLSAIDVNCWCRTGNCETSPSKSGDIKKDTKISLDFGENDPSASNDNHNLTRVKSSKNGWQPNGDYVTTLKVNNQKTNERNIYQDFIIKYNCSSDDCKDKYCTKNFRLYFGHF